MKKLLFLLYFLVGCSDHSIIKVETVDPPPEEPNIIVTPEYIEYGHLISGVESLSELVTIINSGDGILEIEDIGIYGQTNFSHGQPQEFELENSEATNFEVTYEPITFEEKSAHIYIVSNDPDDPVVNVPIHGFGDAPVIEVNPIETDRGVIDLGCEDITEIEISNVGNMDLIVDNIDFWVSPPNDFSLPAVPLPLRVAPGTTEIINVSYEPQDLLADAAMADIDSNDPVTPTVTVTLDATADYGEYVTDTFQQASTSNADILFVVDNSGSMMPLQLSLANNIQSFMAAFALLNVNYQIGVITTDSTVLRGNIITPNTPDPVAELSLQVQTGIAGSPREQGIKMSHDALQVWGSVGPHSGFQRADANLVIVYVSVEPAFYRNNWQQFTNYIETLKPDPAMIIAHAVIGDPPGGCTYNYGGHMRNATFGAGYYDVANYFGGTIYSICAVDWGQQMQSMAFNSIPIASYELSQDPIEDTIEVMVDGQPNNLWWYNSQTNQVEFNSSDAPADEQIIKIKYAILGCQEE